MKQMYVYVMANRSRTLYVGVTNDITRRVWEHKHMQMGGFTRRYLIDRLVYYELASDAESAIVREKQIKGWVRRRKITLIESVNPEWRDLSLDFLDIGPTAFLRAIRRQDWDRRDSSPLIARDGAMANQNQQSGDPSQRGAQDDIRGAT